MSQDGRANADEAPGATSEAEEVEVRREAATMALYVAVCLIAALAAVGESAETGHLSVLGLVWGSTLGLAVAHIFAFGLSAPLVAGGRFDGQARRLVAAQLAGAASVAALVTVPVALLPATSELDVARLILAWFIGGVGYLVARAHGSGWGRALVFAGACLVVATAVALIKNVLSGH